MQRIGIGWTTALMTVLVVLSMEGVHVLLKSLENQPVNFWSLFNIAVENLLVATPLIYYSRRRRADIESVTSRLGEAADEAREASRAKSAFLANMSHELRTPLNAILGFSEIMKDQHLGPISNARYLSYAADIHTSGRHLLGIINDVLDLAKIEAGKMTLEDAGEFALVPSLSTSLSMLAGLGDKHGVSVAGEWQDEDVRLVAVERMVRQIVINLVGNAIKFTPAGGRVTLSGAPCPDGGFVLHVRDNGVGMSESEMVQALTPFGQNRAKLAVRHEGTGLGLPLAKAMIELHGGSLKLESRPDHGTCVSLHFPAERIARSPQRAAA